MVESGITRRLAIKSIAAGSAAALAGCNDQDQPDETESENNGELGERVPEIRIEYWSNAGGTTQIIESVGSDVESDVTSLGVEGSMVPVEFTSQLQNILQDTRGFEFAWWFYSNTPDRLDPNPMTRRFAIDWAGGNGRANGPNYASCEFTEPAIAQSTAPSLEQRQELVNQAQTTLSDDCVTIPTFSRPQIGAYNSNAIDVNNIGELGISPINHQFYIESTPISSDTHNIGETTPFVGTLNFPTSTNSRVLNIHSNLIGSTITGYDKNAELYNIYAENTDTSEDGKTVTIQLREGTFHNGDHVTAEDLKFTIELISSNVGTYPQARELPIEELNVVNDRTLEINLEEPYPPLLTSDLAKWPILHEKTWRDAGAMENPGEVEFDSYIGSGPFQITSFEQGSHIEMEPHNDHPIWDVDHGIFLQGYRDEEPRLRDLLQGNIHSAAQVSPNDIQRLQDETGMVTDISEGFMQAMMFPQYPKAPTKFEEFRKAFASVLNRQQYTEIAYFGEIEPETYATPLAPSHPWRPSDDELYEMGPPEGDAEAGRQILAEEGWNWDDDGNLHYPADADLTPVWPEGEEPNPEDFACLPL